MSKKKKPKGWIDNPKTLADVIQSLKACGVGQVDYRGEGRIDPRKVKL